ncbi:MAG TPA: DUF3011 domain-containing protein [Candidatus Binatia bacterium]|nr:DUF3011 domain-containing protein [Candidatus Binatia bacterium]
MVAPHGHSRAGASALAFFARTFLLVAMAIALLLQPLPAAARRGRPPGAIECSSQHGSYEYCRTFRIGRVELVDQLSKAPCRLYDTWGVDGDGGGIWVRDGCRAIFVVTRAGGGRHGGRHHEPRSVNCTSRDYSYNHCDIPMWGRRVSIRRQLSRQTCRRGDNWGVDWSGIWVDRGCSAIFWVD